mmetsp:Transcript_16614/g.42416  ORF Transcript_16614/g.42416 Transcript_16614/m.42416 type:complete len:399 (-) Transcript_16614:81-1277(-)
MNAYDVAFYFALHHHCCAGHSRHARIVMAAICASDPPGCYPHLREVLAQVVALASRPLVHLNDDGRLDPSGSQIIFLIGLAVDARGEDRVGRRRAAGLVRVDRDFLAAAPARQDSTPTRAHLWQIFSKGGRNALDFKYRRQRGRWGARTGRRLWRQLALDSSVPAQVVHILASLGHPLGRLLHRLCQRGGAHVRVPHGLGERVEVIQGSCGRLDDRCEHAVGLVRAVLRQQGGEQLERACLEHLPRSPLVTQQVLHADHGVIAHACVGRGEQLEQQVDAAALAHLVEPALEPVRIGGVRQDREGNVDKRQPRLAEPVRTARVAHQGRHELRLADGPDERGGLPAPLLNLKRREQFGQRLDRLPRRLRPGRVAKQQCNVVRRADPVHPGCPRAAQVEPA